MKKTFITFCMALAAGLILSAGAGSRVGGNADILYERVGAGGAAFASNGVVKLGGSLGQGGLTILATNANGDVFLNGFWKAEDTCSLYNPTITSLSRSTNNIAITFLVVNGNTYSVSYITQEQGGLPAGAGAITNPVQTLVGVGVAGATTTVWHNVSADTNKVRFYVIRCE